MSRATLLVGLVVATLAAAPVAVATALPAAAAPGPGAVSLPESHGDDLLMLSSEDLDLMSLSPGATVSWQVGAHLGGAPWGHLTVELYADGALVLAEPGLLVRVDSCDVRWTAPDDGPVGCAGTEQELFGEHRVVAEAGTASIDVGMLTPEDSRWLLVQITLPESTPDSSQHLGARLGVGLTATGDERTPTPPPSTPGPTAGPTPGPTARPVPGPPVGVPVAGPAPQPERTTPPDVGPGPDRAVAAAPVRPAPARAGSGLLARTGSEPLAALALGVGSVLAGLLLAGLARVVRPGRR